MKAIRVLMPLAVLLISASAIHAQTSEAGVKPIAVSPVPADAIAEGGGVEQAGWFGISMPKVSMPQVTMPKVTMPELPKLWPSADGHDDKPALLTPVAVGARKVSEGTRKAWEGTKQIFSFGSRETTKPDARTKESKPSFWSRLFGAPQEPAVPQTVGEWMAQERVGT